MIFGSKELDQIYANFKTGHKMLDSVEVEIVGGEAEVSPLILLRAYEQAELSIDDNAALAAAFVMNREIRFKRGEEILFETKYTGGDLSELFTKVPYLFDVLLKVAYALMIKKLTPPSTDSSTDDTQ